MSRSEKLRLSFSTASIAGQLHAWGGIDAVPHRWVRRVDIVTPLLVLAHDLGTIDTDRQTLRSYPPN